MSVFDWEDNTLDPEEAAARGHRAGQILADPVFSGALTEVEQTFLREWLQGDRVEVREAAHAKIHALYEIRRVLESYVADATVVAPRRR